MATPRYIVRADLLSIAPPYLQAYLLDDDHDGVEDTGVADQIIEDAADEVDAILSARYNVPFSLSAPPPLVTWATKWLAWYYAHLRRSKMAPLVEAKYKTVLDRLYAAADPGTRDIVSGTGEDPEPESSTAVRASFGIGSQAPVMNRTALANPSTGY